MSEAEHPANQPSEVDLVETVSGLRAHIRVDGEVLCHARQPSRTFQETDEVPDGGICNHCERLATIQNVEVFPDD